MIVVFVCMTGKERLQGPMKAWAASSVGTGGNSSGGPSGSATGSGGNGGNIVTQVSSDNESVESSPSAKSRETSPTASPMMPARRLVPASSGDELENEPDPGNASDRIKVSHLTKEN